jgi:predicted RecB family endonuclease
MRTIEEIRRVRLQMLVTEHGTITKLKVKAGYSDRDATLNQYLNASIATKGGKPKEMGSKVARRIEEALALEVGWMDNDPELPFSDDLVAVLRELDKRALRKVENSVRHNLDMNLLPPFVESEPGEGAKKAPSPHSRSPRRHVA